MQYILMHVLPNLKYLLFYSLTAETYFGLFISYVYPFLAQEIYESLTLAKHKSKSRVRLCSHLVPEHGARVRFLMGINVNTPFLQVPTLEFGLGARARVQGLYLVLGH